jgi:hypothetical protein
MIRMFLSIRRLPALALAASLAGCIYSPQQVAGLDPNDAWTSLPLRAWLAEERGEAEAIAACFGGECRDRIGVGVFLLKGEAARDARAVLDDPRRLVTDLRARERRDENEKRKKIDIAIDARPVTAGPARGFELTMASRQDPARVAVGVVLARPEGDGLRVVMAVGEDRAVVDAAARQAAAEVLGANGRGK